MDPKLGCYPASVSYVQGVGHLAVQQDPDATADAIFDIGKFGVVGVWEAAKNALSVVPVEQTRRWQIVCGGYRGRGWEAMDERDRMPLLNIDWNMCDDGRNKSVRWICEVVTLVLVLSSNVSSLRSCSLGELTWLLSTG